MFPLLSIKFLGKNIKIILQMSTVGIQKEVCIYEKKYYTLKIELWGEDRGANS
jgi:hypothetical protein